VSTDVVDGTSDWRRLDRRMLLVHPVKDIGRYLLPLIALVVFGRSSSSEGGRWGLFVLGLPIVLGLLRYVTTSYRLTPERIELRHGLLNKKVTSAALDRVRTVDVTASPIHRLLGLVTLQIGTGHSSTKADQRMALDGLSIAAAGHLRDVLLHVSPTADRGAPPEDNRRVVLTLDPAWVRFAPLTSAGVVIAGAALGIVAQAFRTLEWAPSVDTHRLARLGVTLLVLVALASFAIVLCVLAVIGYLVTNFGFQLSHTRSDGSWHLRRGLFTTRETSLDDARVAGVSIGEPLGLRLAHGARLSAIVSGLNRKQQGSSVLVPPAPRAEVDRVAAEVLGTRRPVLQSLVDHGPRARRRRWTRAMVPAVAVAVVLALASYELASWLTPFVVLALLCGAFLAVDRTRALGHSLVDGFVVARSGSLNRRREALAAASVIGWNLRATWFQRRAGLTDLVATTAGGRQRVQVLDLSEAAAVTLARTAQPGLLEQFMV
jgi:putative membrane protein